jgi:hypothetical protein
LTQLISGDKKKERKASGKKDKEEAGQVTILEIHRH